MIFQKKYILIVMGIGAFVYHLSAMFIAPKQLKVGKALIQRKIYLIPYPEGMSLEEFKKTPGKYDPIVVPLEIAEKSKYIKQMHQKAIGKPGQPYDGTDEESRLRNHEEIFIETNNADALKNVIELYSAERNNRPIPFSAGNLVHMLDSGHEEELIRYLGMEESLQKSLSDYFIDKMRNNTLSSIIELENADEDVVRRVLEQVVPEFLQEKNIKVQLLMPYILKLKDKKEQIDTGKKENEDLLFFNEHLMIYGVKSNIYWAYEKLRIKKKNQPDAFITPEMLIKTSTRTVQISVNDNATYMIWRNTDNDMYEVWNLESLEKYVIVPTQVEGLPTPVNGKVVTCSFDGNNICTADSRGRICTFDPADPASFKMIADYSSWLSKDDQIMCIAYRSKNNVLAGVTDKNIIFVKHNNAFCINRVLEPHRTFNLQKSRAENRTQQGRYIGVEDIFLDESGAYISIIRGFEEAGRKYNDKMFLIKIPDFIEHCKGFLQRYKSIEISDKPMGSIQQYWIKSMPIVIVECLGKGYGIFGSSSKNMMVWPSNSLDQCESIQLPYGIVSGDGKYCIQETSILGFNKSEQKITLYDDVMKKAIDYLDLTKEIDNKTIKQRVLGMLFLYHIYTRKERQKTPLMILDEKETHIYNDYLSAEIQMLLECAGIKPRAAVSKKLLTSQPVTKEKTSWSQNLKNKLLLGGAAVIGAAAAYRYFTGKQYPATK